MEAEPMSFESMNGFSPSDELFRGHDGNLEDEWNANENTDDTTASPSLSPPKNGEAVAETQQEMELDYSNSFDFDQLLGDSPSLLPFEPPVNAYPTIPNGNNDTVTQNIKTLFQPQAFVSTSLLGSLGGDVSKLQNTSGGAWAPSTSENINSANLGGTQFATVLENNEAATPQQTHGIHLLPEEENGSFLGNSGEDLECNAAQTRSLERLIVVNDQKKLREITGISEDAQQEIGRVIISPQELAHLVEQTRGSENDGENQQQQETLLDGLSNGENFMEVEESHPSAVVVPELVVDSSQIINQNSENSKAESFLATYLSIISNTNQDNVSELSHSSASDQTGYVITDLGDSGAKGNPEQNHSLLAATGRQTSTTKISTKRNRKEKKVKMYERKDVDDPKKVPRAKNAKNYREKKKQAEEKLKAEYSSLQEKCQHLTDELGKCRKRITAQDETITKLKRENKQLAVQNKELEGKSKKLPTPVHTREMIEYFHDTVSKLPNNCQVVITPQLAEMRVPQLPVTDSQQICQGAGQDAIRPEGSEPPLKLTAFYDISGGS
ncbi:unnamed protein product [Orchesella dallaii]|uniref:BZIP domain-containing protein n=1 Tax=Orchesella dallaii TaxID=48710 RepID=A0ABP1RIS3_9HEXA